MIQIVPVGEIPTETRKLEPQEAPAVFVLCEKMAQLCRQKRGQGMAAVQVGVDWKLFIAETTGKLEYYVNCEYEPAPGAKKVFDFEGCLSLPNKLYYVPRWSVAVVRGSRVVVVNNEVCFEPFEISTPHVVFQHEIDHQNGVLISDIGHDVTII